MAAEHEVFESRLHGQQLGGLLLELVDVCESAVLDNPLEIHLVVFEVHDMTCGHCVSSITQAVSAIDQGAQVTVDLATHREFIGPTESNRSESSQALREAGYSPVPVEVGVAPVERAAPRSGCCCR